MNETMSSTESTMQHSAFREGVLPSDTARAQLLLTKHPQPQMGFPWKEEEEFLGKGRGQMPKKFLQEPRNSLPKFLQSSFAGLRNVDQPCCYVSLPPKF